MSYTIERYAPQPANAWAGNDLPDLLQRIYRHRGICQASELDYRLQQLLHFSTLKDIDRAATRIAQAIMQQQSILIVGDYDVDGATSTALAVQALQALGARQVSYIVPNRFEFGYGLSPAIVALAVQHRPQMIITVDNGIASIEGVALAKQQGIDVIITDHHLPGQTLPCADAIVNPNQPGCTFASKALCGCGVIFYVMVATRAALREQGWFSAERLEPNLSHYLDLLALATVADVVALDHNNRLLVHNGLQRIRAGQACMGIQALLQVAGRQARQVTAADMGFALGPRLNAAGRLQDMSIGIECLLTHDPVRARQLALQLHELNVERRDIERSMQTEALALLQQKPWFTAPSPDAMPFGICLHDPCWHEGIIGILASRIKERLHRPVIIFATAEDGTLKGSGRSIEGFHLRDGLDWIAQQQPGLLHKFGGHAMAAGLTLDQAALSLFNELFDQAVRQQLQPQQLSTVLYSDGELRPDEFTLQMAQALEQAGPWGQGFAEPCFDNAFIIMQQRLVGEKHLKLKLQHPQHSLILDAIAFNVDTQHWPNTQLRQAQFVYTLTCNEYRGQQQVQLRIRHIEVP